MAKGLEPIIFMIVFVKHHEMRLCFINVLTALITDDLDQRINVVLGDTVGLIPRNLGKNFW